MYPGATPANVQVTNGAAEANLLTALTLIQSGDEVIGQLPNYMQLWGVFNAIGADTKPWNLTPDLVNECWNDNLDELEGMVTSNTKMIALCNPNNPSGHILGADELDRIARIAEKVGAWVLVDEIYQGMEISGTPTPTMCGSIRQSHRDEQPFKILRVAGIEGSVGFSGRNQLSNSVGGRTTTRRSPWEH